MCTEIPWMCVLVASPAPLARTVYIRRIWPYIWWFPYEKYSVFTVYIWFWPTLHMYAWEGLEDLWCRGLRTHVLMNCTDKDRQGGDHWKSGQPFLQKVLPRCRKIHLSSQDPWLHLFKHPCTLNFWREVPRWAGWTWVEIPAKRSISKSSSPVPVKITVF